MLARGAERNPVDDDLTADLRTQITAGRVVAFVGAGVSIGASGSEPLARCDGLLQSGIRRCEEVNAHLPPGWGDRVRAEIASGDMDDLLSAAEKVTSKLGGLEAGSTRSGCRMPWAAFVSTGWAW